MLISPFVVVESADALTGELFFYVLQSTLRYFTVTSSFKGTFFVSQLGKKSENTVIEEEPPPDGWMADGAWEVCYTDDADKIGMYLSDVFLRQILHALLTGTCSLFSQISKLEQSAFLNGEAHKLQRPNNYHSLSLLYFEQLFETFP